MTLIRIRGGSGLGDGLYVQGVARHFVESGHQVEVCSNYPDVFRPLKECIVSPFRSVNVDRIAHYSLRRHETATDQFQDCCLQAGIRDKIVFRLDWIPLNVELIGAIRRATTKPIILVQLPRTPMNRVDGYGAELLPDCNIIQAAIDFLGPHAYLVQVGNGEALFRFSGIDFDLSNRTTVTDLLDVAWMADGCLGYVSFLVPLAESLRKPGLMVWSRRGLNSSKDLIARLTPQKVIHRRDLLRAVVDDCSGDELLRAVNALLDEVRSPLAA